MLLRQRRTGATVVECALIFPLFFLLLIGLIVAGLGVFRYQEVANLAREGARYASVRGHNYEFKTGKPAATDKEIFDNAIKPNAVGVDQKLLNYTVKWDPDNRQGSKVTVTLTYRWVPEAFLGGINLSSTSTMTISY